MAIHHGPYTTDRAVERVTSNLVAYYNFKESMSYPGSGTTITDLVDGDFNMTM